MILLHRLSGVIAALTLAALLSLPAEAQDAAPAEGDQATEAAPAEEAPADEAPAEEPAPSFAPPLTSPETPVEEFNLRLIPLTVDELTALADEWMGEVRATTEEVIERQITFSEAGDDTRETAEEQLNEARDRRRAVLERFSLTVDALERKGGAPEAVAAYRSYRNAILVDETQTADWRTLVSRSLNWATSRDGGIALAIRIGVILVALLALFFVARIVRRLAGGWLGRVPNLSKLLQSFLALVAYWLTIAFGLMIVLAALGVNVTPLFALVGGASFIMAFALQDTLGNLAAGLMIMINRPFDEGDYVDIAGTAGTVKAVSIVSTTVTTPDNQVIVIPNSKVWGNVITNVTASDTRRVDLVFGIGYDDSIEDAQRVLEETVASHPLILKEPEPVIRVNALGSSSVDFVCRPWVRSENYWTVYWDLTRQVKERFDAAGISIPFPQTDMHIHMVESAASFPPSRPERTPPSHPADAPGDTLAERYAAGDSETDPGDDSNAR